MNIRAMNVAMRSLLSLSWGLFADIDVESERFRWLGGARFTAQAIVRILFPPKYRGATAARFKPLRCVGDHSQNEPQNGPTRAEDVPRFRTRDFLRWFRGASRGETRRDARFGFGNLRAGHG